MCPAINRSTASSVRSTTSGLRPNPALAGSLRVSFGGSQHELKVSNGFTMHTEPRGVQFQTAIIDLSRPRDPTLKEVVVLGSMLKDDSTGRLRSDPVKISLRQDDGWYGRQGFYLKGDLTTPTGEPYLGGGRLQIRRIDVLRSTGVEVARFPKDVVLDFSAKRLQGGE